MPPSPFWRYRMASPARKSAPAPQSGSTGAVGRTARGMEATGQATGAAFCDTVTCHQQDPLSRSPKARMSIAARALDARSSRPALLAS
jgi:hypothetical protein